MNNKIEYNRKNLSMIYKCCDDRDDSDDKMVQSSENYYYMLFVLEGCASVVKEDLHLQVSTNQLVLVDINVNFSFRFHKDGEFEYLLIKLHPCLFSHFSEDGFLRPFTNEYMKNYSVIDLCQKLPRFERILQNFWVIKHFIKYQLSPEHILPRIYSIISDLCLTFDNILFYDENSTDSEDIPKKLINYLNRHYTENITYELIMEKYYISKPTISAIMHLYTGKSLKQYVTWLRVNDGKIMLNNGKTATETAELCGYDSYSSFYRAYKSVFGVTPTKSKSKK